MAPNKTSHLCCADIHPGELHAAGVKVEGQLGTAEGCVHLNLDL